MPQAWPPRAPHRCHAGSRIGEIRVAQATELHGGRTAYRIERERPHASLADLTGLNVASGASHTASITVDPRADTRRRHGELLTAGVGGQDGLAEAGKQSLLATPRATGSLNGSGACRAWACVRRSRCVVRAARRSAPCCEAARRVMRPASRSACADGSRCTGHTPAAARRSCDALRGVEVLVPAQRGTRLLAERALHVADVLAFFGREFGRERAHLRVG